MKPLINDEKHIKQRECSRKRYREDYTVPEKRKEILRKFRDWAVKNRDKQRRWSREWRKKNPTYHIEYNHKHHENQIASAINADLKHPELRLARYLARREVKLAKCCAYCGSTKMLERHHPDYSKPFEVITLCRKCHALIPDENSVEKVKV